MTGFWGSGKLRKEVYKRHGRARMVWSDGTTLVGYWVEDVSHGPNKIYYPDGAVMKINYVKGQRHG